jgi:hypothetical protein
MSPVVRQRLPPTSGPHFQTSSQPYWQRLKTMGATGSEECLMHFLVSGFHQLELF